MTSETKDQERTEEELNSDTEGQERTEEDINHQVPSDCPVVLPTNTTRTSGRTKKTPRTRSDDFVWTANSSNDFLWQTKVQLVSIKLL